MNTRLEGAQLISEFMLAERIESYTDDDTEVSQTFRHQFLDWVFSDPDRFGAWEAVRQLHDCLDADDGPSWDEQPSLGVCLADGDPLGLLVLAGDKTWVRP